MDNKKPDNKAEVYPHTEEELKAGEKELEDYANALLKALNSTPKEDQF